MLQPVVRRTWAPKGRTPIHYSWDRHDRLSTIAAITMSPRRLRFGLYFEIHDHNIRFDDVMVFITELHRCLRRKFILVLDRYSVHRKAVRLLQERHPDWFEVEWLPAYAPDLNPVEMIWNHTKYGDLANFLFPTTYTTCVQPSRTPLTVRVAKRICSERSSVMRAWNCS